MIGKLLVLAERLRSVLFGFALGVLYTFCFSLSRRTVIVMIICFALTAAIELAEKLESKPATAATPETAKS